eukprot:TRINITY_DN5639_c0_g1_i11.p1 TRINITY_DN5639_c0_g1~~TRINITY_DN5639_c0_g1_i11.p1  ORF type:complete len:641 (-),score=170.98 TRINITY_DN5639_c0_g1_i11:118-2040(-)
MTFFGAYLFVFGGNTGTIPVNDIWCLSIEKAPFSWMRINCGSELPQARVYHSAAHCTSGSAAGMMVVFGGRGADQAALSDTWGFRKHRDGSWDWVRAPYRAGSVPPLGRYQHSALFINSTMAVVGGRTNSINKPVPLEMYDTETSEWTSYQSAKRFRHASWFSEGLVYVYGGFQQDSPNIPTDSIVCFDFASLFRAIPMEEETKVPLHPPTKSLMTISKVLPRGAPAAACKGPKKPKESKEFRLSNQAHVAMSFNVADPDNDLGNFVRKVPVEELQEEARKLAGQPKLPIAATERSPNEPLYSMFINHLMKPSAGDSCSPFVFHKEYVIELTKEFQALLQSQPTVIKLRAPLKVFGNIHGDLHDLLRIFETWKGPVESNAGGDIDSVAYLFLGNYVDRGSKGLETVCLLMALKLKYPDAVHLLRGSHEDRLVNAVYGFADECAAKLHENVNERTSVFQAINDAFAWLPLGAVVEDKILCVHGGIGPSITRVEDLNKVTRPIELCREMSVEEQAILLNCLWSDPSAAESEAGFAKNTLRSNISTDHIFKFGVDVLAHFLEENNLELIVRGHEVAQNGIDVFGNSKMITVTSCANYCGSYTNPACILVILKTLEIVPKLILPSGGSWADTKKRQEPLTPPRR